MEPTEVMLPVHQDLVGSWQAYLAGLNPDESVVALDFSDESVVVEENIGDLLADPLAPRRA